MGLLSTTYVTHASASYPQSVTHKHETAPEQIAKLHDMQRELVRDFVLQDAPENSLVSMRAWRSEETRSIHYAFRLNGRDYSGRLPYVSRAMLSEVSALAVGRELMHAVTEALVAITPAEASK